MIHDWKMASLIRSLRHEWTKNDGKPWEEWSPGRDLKEMVLIGALAICTGLMIFGTIMLMRG